MDNWLAVYNRLVVVVVVVVVVVDVVDVLDVVVVGALRTDRYVHFQLVWGFSCDVHSQHSEEGGRKDRMEEKLRYHYQYQYHHNYPPPPTLTDQAVGGGK